MCILPPKAGQGGTSAAGPKPGGTGVTSSGTSGAKTSAPSGVVDGAGGGGAGGGGGGGSSAVRKAELGAEELAAKAGAGTGKDDDSWAAHG